FRAAALGRDQIDFHRLARRCGHESDPLAIGGPARQLSLHRGEAELEPLTAIDFTAPQSALWEGHVSRPLPVLRTIQVRGGNPGEERHKLAREGVIAYQLATGNSAHGKEPFPILAHHSAAEAHRPGGQLYRLVTCLAEQIS